MNGVEIKINYASFEKLINFYNNNNTIFYPPLDSQVQSIEDYVRKLENNATIFEAWIDTELVGLVAIYLNNYKNKTGFITSVIVSLKNQKQGIANKLLNETIKYAHEKEFLKINLEVHKENSSAINLYKKLGFKEKQNDFISLELDI